MKHKPKLGVGRTIIFFPFHMDLRQMKRRYLSLTLYKLYGAIGKDKYDGHGDFDGGDGQVCLLGFVLPRILFLSQEYLLLVFP